MYLHGKWDAVSPSIFQFGPPAGVQSYMFFSEMCQHMLTSLTNYRNCRLHLYCEYSLAHAVKAVVSVKVHA